MKVILKLDNSGKRVVDVNFKASTLAGTNEICYSAPFTYEQDVSLNHNAFKESRSPYIEVAEELLRRDIKSVTIRVKVHFYLNEHQYRQLINSKQFISVYQPSRKSGERVMFLQSARNFEIVCCTTHSGKKLNSEDLELHRALFNLLEHYESYYGSRYNHSSIVSFVTHIKRAKE